MPAERAFVLSGGGSRGDFEVGALTYLFERGILPDGAYRCTVGSIRGDKLLKGGSQAFGELPAIRSRTELAPTVVRAHAAERGAVSPEHRETP